MTVRDRQAKPRIVNDSAYWAPVKRRGAARYSSLMLAVLITKAVFFQSSSQIF